MRVEERNRKRSLLAFAAALLLAGTAQAQEEETRNIELYLGASEVIEAPWLVKRMSVTNSKIADVQALTPTQILVLGKALGSTDLLLWSETEQVWKAQLHVVANLEQLKTVLARALPGSDLELIQSQDVVVVSGSLARAEQIPRLKNVMASTKLAYVDATRLAGVQQVQIQVKVAEVSRTALRSLGVNGVMTGNDAFGGLVTGPDSGGPINPINIGIPAGAAPVNDVPFTFLSSTSVTPVVTLFGGFPDANLEFFLQALSENQYLRILAEPTLVALSGESANFLAGGEFPIPVVQGGSGSTSVTIEYKEFGVRLAFTPTVLGENQIRLRVAPEVSELTNTGAVEIEGFQVPAVFTRRSETTLEMRSGQTFAMAGLLSSTEEARNSKIPLLGDLPILGPLFRSIRYKRDETELVVMVTANLVSPSSTDNAPLPGSIRVPVDDWDLFLNGNIDGRIPGVPPKAVPDLFRTLKLERLKGPGAWRTYEN